MKKLNRFLYFLAFLKFVLPFVLQSSVYEPHRDEFLYLAEGTHPAFGYMEVPPLLSVLAWITHHLGNSLFWIKFWPALFGAFNFILVGKIIISRAGGAFSLFLLFCCFFFSAYLRVHFLFQPNFLEIFFYTCISFGLIRYLQMNENKWLYVTGAAAGFGLLSKYSIAFFLLSLIPALLITKERRIFLNKHLYYASALAMFIFLPNLIWQYLNHFPVIYHMQELRTTQLQYVPASQFLIEQLVMFMPCFFVWITGFFYLIVNRNEKTFVFLSWTYLGVIILLLIFHGKNYYSLGLYPLLLGFGSLAIERWTQAGSRYFLRFAFATIVITLGVYFTFIGLPVLKPSSLAIFYEKTHARKYGALRWEDQKDHALPQDFADMLGWEEMARKTAAAFYSMDSVQRANAIIFCDNYGMAGAVNYYGKKYGLPEAYSDNASFLYWIPDSIHFQNLVLVESDPHEMEYNFIKQFNSAVITDSVTNPYARERSTAIMLLKGASDGFQKFYTEKLNADKLKTHPY